MTELLSTLHSWHKEPFVKLNDPCRGETYGRLTVLRTVRMSGNHRIVAARCECGSTIEARLNNLRTGNTESCGCLQQERTSEANRTHGETGSRLWLTWRNMWSRCTSPSNTDWNRYGGRGITVCDAWNEFERFRDWAVTHGYADTLTLERIDNDGNYTPLNCRWSTRAEQARNRSTNLVLTAFGETMTATDWAEDPRCAVTYRTLQQRVTRCGWVHEKAISTPARRRR